MLSIQAADARGRAPAAYARLLVSALLRRGSEHEVFLYGHDEYPREAIPSGPRATLVVTNFGRPAGETTPAGRLEWLAQSNPERLDWLVVLDPFAAALGLGPPAKPLNALKLAAVVPDLTPFVLPERDLDDREQAERGYRALSRLRQYDAILTPTEATRDAAVALLGVDAGRVFVIGAAADGRTFTPEVSLPMPLADRRLLYDLGIRRAFVLVDAGRPGQKNVGRMIRAFEMLPEPLRAGYQLVFVGDARGVADDRARAADDPDRGEDLVLNGAVPETSLRALYRHASVFVHPALYEGFGQAILEALHCGALVVAGDNSAQGELLGDAGLLADPADPAAIAAQVARALDDRTLARMLRARALARARRFHAERAADAALEVLARPGRPLPTTATRLRFDRPHRARPRIAFFSPLPPRITGIADYAVRLLEELKRTYAIDLYHDAGYLPDLGLKGRDFAVYDARLFDRNNVVLDYHAIVYQMGNSLEYHGYLYDVLLRHPGLVTLHDFFLSVYPYRDTRGGAEVLASFRREIRHYCPERAGEFLPQLDAWCEEEGGLAAACVRRGLYLNRRVFEASTAVVVHSPWCREQVRAWMPEHVERTVVIPMGVDPPTRPDGDLGAIRQRFGLPRDALIVACIGFVHPDKLVVEALDAFRPLAEADANALFVCVGQENDGGEARRHAAALGLSGRVRFLGRQPGGAFADLIAAADLGINLRRPPTNGETSAALLDLLAAGVPTIVNDIATFADYPDAVVRKVRWDAQGPDALARAVSELARDRPAREALGRSARDYVREQHAWSRSSARYAELIERCAEARRLAPATPRRQRIAQEAPGIS
jgi:glycosyltransferase involved in cell wall biosynthesis